MKYTIQLDLFIDDDEVYTDEQIKEVLDLAMESINCDVSNVMVVEVDD